MAATATKRMEPQLSEEVRELYDRCWKIANESLQKLGIDTAFLQKMKDPLEFSKLLEQRRAPRELIETHEKLNHIFTAENKLPEKIIDDEKLVKFFSDYIEKNFGKKLNVDIRERRHEAAAYAHTNTIMLPQGSLVLDAVISIPHEMSHIDEPFGRKLNELDAMLMPMMLRRTDPLDVVVGYARLTGVSPKDVAEELNVQRTYGQVIGVVFLIDLYDVGLYKPTDEKVKQNLEFSRFMLDRDMRRAFMRYKEGRAQYETLSLLKSGEEVVKARAALEVLRDMAMPTPEALSGSPIKDMVTDSKQNEGFRFYHDLQKKLGEENLRRFELMCAERDWMPGIDKYGRLVIIDSKRLRMFEVDTEKMMENKPKMPEKME